MPCHFGEVFARAARFIWRGAQQRRLVMCFDVDGPELLIDLDDIALYRGMYRLCLAVQELASAGVMMMDGRIRPARAGLYHLSVRLSVAGALADAATVDAVLARLGLHEVGADVTAGGRPRLRRATGTCPCTGATLRLAHSPAQGVVVIAEHDVAGEPLPEPAAGQGPWPPGGAWIVSAEPMSARTLANRLQRVGWSGVTVMRPADALRRLRTYRASAANDATPALLLLVDSPNGHEAKTASQLIEWLPESTRKWLAVPLGSPALSGAARPRGFEVVPRPLGPALLRRLMEPPSRRHAPSPANPAWTRRPMLVVDDEPVNREVAVQMLKALGEHAVVASDGEQALDRCRTLHPTMVLMDVQMPRLDGIEATRALRALQATGDVAPCPIVVASAMLDERVGTACHEAGVDVSLPKPIELGALRTQIERFCPPGP